jgi:hypothetical protein
MFLGIGTVRLNGSAKAKGLTSQCDRMMEINTLEIHHKIIDQSEFAKIVRVAE